MKKILLINGSPKGKSSNTRKITNAFLTGLNKDNSYTIEEIMCSQAHIEECRGCFSCWRNEQGTCVIKDDMQELISKYIEADMIIWSFPNYFYGMPSTCKKFMDRLISLYSPFLVKKDTNISYHPHRTDIKQRPVFVFCTCGYYNTKSNTEALQKEFELIYGNNCTSVFIPEGQLFSNNFLSYRYNALYELLEQFGCSYAENGYVNESQLIEINKAVLEIDDFIEFVNQSVVIRTPKMSDAEYILNKEKSFFKTMALTYDPSMLQVENSILEIEILDFPFSCQMHLNKKCCEYIEEKSLFKPYRLKIISDLSFFVSNPKLAKNDDKVHKPNAPDFNSIISLINRFEIKGISKEMKFG